MTPEIEALGAAGLLSALDVHFADSVARTGGETRPDVLLAAALVSQRVSRGDVCVDLGELDEEAEPRDEAGRPVAGVRWPRWREWRAELESSPLVASVGCDPLPARPLVLDARGRLYLRRYWEHQERLAAALRGLACRVDGSLDVDLLHDGLRRLFPPSAPAAEPDWQRLAAAAALGRAFTVISGGPGTGKTHTVVKILALLVEQALGAGRRPPRLSLAAPTGKAAARLGESIRRAKGDLDCAEEVRAAIPEEAATLHRLLGASLGSDTRFRHHDGNPLAADLVLVDEASMVDLALMARLVDALPAPARLILLGDKDQLASVEAGAVLADICQPRGRRSRSRAFAAMAERLAGERLPLEVDAPAETGIWDATVELVWSYRYGPESGIGRLARAINAGRADEALKILSGADWPDAVLAPPVPEWSLGARLGAAVVEGYGPFLRDGLGAEDRLLAFDRFRVLCAHRSGGTGVAGLNREIEKHLAEQGLLRPRAAFYHGRPVLVTRNDYRQQVFNGDVGLVIEEPGGAARAACFLVAPGAVRRIAPSRLPPHETAFALTVHRSQGSEFDEVAIVLPEKASRVVTRELLYTAVTRARKRVTVYAAAEVIAAAVAHPTRRASGLADALWTSGDGPESSKRSGLPGVASPIRND